MRLYSHGYSIAFDVKTLDPTGKHPNPQDVREGILGRLAGLTDDELVGEAIECNEVDMDGEPIGDAGGFYSPKPGGRD